MRLRRSLPLFIILMLMVVSSFAFTVQAQDTTQTCDAVASSALTALGTNCANLDRNTTCYGSPEIVHSAFTEAVPDGFYTQPGDRASLSITESIQTGAFSQPDGQWGLNVMNVNANVPAAASVKGVVFVQLGGVEVENDVEPAAALELPAVGLDVPVAAGTNLMVGEGAFAVLASVPAGTTVSVDALSEDGSSARAVFEGLVGWISTDALDPQVDLSDLPVITEGALTPMQAFYVRTGLGAAPCTAAPSLLVIQGPNNTPADLFIYEQHVRIMSTIVVRLSADGSSLELIVLSGLAILNPGTPDEIIVPPGFITSIALGPDLLDLGIEGDADDRGTVGSWSLPRPLTEEELDALGTLEDIPGNLIHYEIDVPVINLPSGVGSPLPVLVFENEAQLEAAQQACDAGLLPADVCEYLGVS